MKIFSKKKKKILHENRVDMTKKKRYNIEVIGATFD